MKIARIILLGWLCASAISQADPIMVLGNINYTPALGLTNVPASATNVIELAGGDTHALALRANGTVVAWGNAWPAITNVPPDLTNVVSVAAGSTHSLALRSDGSLAAWGYIYFSGINIVVPPDATNVAALALGPGAQHALVLKADGTVVDWGNNSYRPVIPPNAKDIVSVASGSYFSFALRSDGTLVSWTSVSGAPAPPTPLPGVRATNIVAIATSWGGIAALRADGTVLAWGDSITPPSNSGFPNIIDLAALGSSSDTLALRRNGTIVEYASSVPKYPTNMITAIGAGSYTGFAVVGSGPPVFPGLPVNRTVTSGSRAYFRMLAVGAMPINYQWTCTGTNLPGATNSILILTNVQPNLAGSIYSLIASNTFGMATSGPVMLNENPSEAYITVTATAAMVNQTVTFTGSMIGQGPFTYQWQLNGTNLPAATNLVLTLTNAQPTDAGNYSLLASNSYGIVTNFASLTVAPTIITSLPQNQIAFIDGTASFNLGLQAMIPVTYKWQYNGVNLDGATNNTLTLTNTQYAQDGTYSIIFTDAFETVTNSATLAVVPVAAWGYIGQQSLPSGLTNVVAIANGDYYELALQADGTVVGWGDNSVGGANPPPGVSNIISIAAGYDVSLALKSDGTVAAWGNNIFIQTNVLYELTNAVAVAIGGHHALVLKSDGTVVAWGSNNNGQTNVPANLTNVVAIAASDYCSMALRADGTVFAWGAISNVPPSVTNGVQIATGSDDLVLQADGSIIGWGSNDSGQDNMPAGLSNVVAIAIGYSQSAALKTDGTLVAWGANQYGQSSVPSGLTNVVALRGNGYQNLALIGNGPPILQVAISNCAWTAGGFQFAVPSQSGRVYALEYKDSLTDGNWSALPLAAGTGGMITLTDPTATHSQRFYRVRRW